MYEKTNHDVCVIGLGQLGLPLALSFAIAGCNVIGVDKDKVLVTKIYQKEISNHIAEPDVKEALDHVIKYCDFQVTSSTDYGVANSSYIIIMVGTPSAYDGSFSINQVLRVCAAIAPHLKDSQRTVIVSSTINPGDCNDDILCALEIGGAKRGKDFNLCYWPEFVALGKMMSGFTNPPYIILGADTEEEKDSILLLAEDVTHHGEIPTRIFCTSIANAEMIKLSTNVAISNKVILANHIGYICESLKDVDGREVLKGVGMDSRIGDKYFSIGTPVGGPCFPRDLDVMGSIEYDIGRHEMCLVDNMAGNNELYTQYLISKVAKLISEAENDVLVIMGLAFKEGTKCNVSFGYELSKYFRSSQCRTYDSAVYSGNPSLTDTMYGAGTIAVTRHHSDADLDELIEALMPGQIVFDPWRIVDEQAVVSRGARYETVGRHPSLKIEAKEDHLNYIGKKCLVTGGTGMIGREVCRLLVEEKAIVTSVSLELPEDEAKIKGVTYLVDDLTESGVCDRLASIHDTIFHVAGTKGNPGVSKSRVSAFYTPMLQMGMNIVSSAIKYNIQTLVFVSSIGAYPPGKEIYFESLDTNEYPMDLPGLAKLAIEEAMRAHINECGKSICWSIVRPSNVYGPGDNFDPETGMVIPSLIAKACLAKKSGEDVVVWGDGKAVRDFVYCTDVARGILAAGRYGMHNYTYVNLGGSDAYSINTVAEIICSHLDVLYVYDKTKPSGFPRRVLSNVAALLLWGWKPGVRLEEGITQTIEWYLANGQEKNRYNPLKGEQCQESM